MSRHPLRHFFVDFSNFAIDQPDIGMHAEQLLEEMNLLLPLLDVDEESFVIVTGDGNDNKGFPSFRQVIVDLVAAKFRVELWAWYHKLNHFYTQFQQTHKKFFVIQPLNTLNSSVLKRNNDGCNYQGKKVVLGSKSLDSQASLFRNAGFLCKSVYNPSGRGEEMVDEALVACIYEQLTASLLKIDKERKEIEERERKQKEEMLNAIEIKDRTIKDLTECIEENECLNKMQKEFMEQQLQKLRETIKCKETVPSADSHEKTTTNEATTKKRSGKPRDMNMAELQLLATSSNILLKKLDINPKKKKKKYDADDE
jgi:hypothetical protein